jgi:hypothetical protein
MPTQEINSHDMAILLAIIGMICFGILAVLINIPYILETKGAWANILKDNLLLVGLMLFYSSICFGMYRYHIVIDFENERIAYRGNFSKNRIYPFKELISIVINSKSNYIYYFKFNDSFEFKIDTSKLRQMTSIFEMKFSEIINILKENSNVEIQEI